ncbi:RagB/SusD family nutrient uptake outer membrane protein [uncultured Dokdonia sp.]|uniref:RagB/SusD family nutrient uptake outer membrane protein n=1 Tax=uncultured Dokdonia sp. TaxID=575653 RepID=UPI0026120FE7|nr:RagB/SusD family nutrient uptake outer membrane protein [uncultured Dokdonia sp.]
MNKIFFKNVVLLIVAVFIISCDDDVPVTNTNALNPDIFFESLNQVEGAVNASYNQLQTLYQRNGYIFPDAFSDEMISGGDPNFAPFFNFELNPTLGGIALYWTACYNGIGACNFVISNEERMMNNAPTSNFTTADVNDAVGQALFLRGLYYYLLVKRFGGVPIKNDFTTALNDAPRSTEDEIYEFIIQDLTRSSQITFSKGATETGRATNGAAYSLLGKVYLHRGMYVEAQDAFSNVVDYSLLPLELYEDNFNEGGEHNDESIFEVGYNGEFGTEAERWAQTGVGTSELTFHAQEYTGWGNLQPSPKLMEEFEEDDPRKEVALVDVGQAYGPDGIFTFPGPGLIEALSWQKFSQLYEAETVQENSGINARVLRYADVVLMQAEVELNLGNSTGAINFLNQIRERLELPLYGSAEMDERGFPVDTPNGIFNAIVHERFVELCGEQVRFDDLVRWNLDGSELSILPNADFDNPSAAIPRGYDPNIHRLMPIPQNEIDSNTQINGEDQNFGY